MSTIRLERLENPNTSNGGIDIDSSGNVGINTTTPGTKLEVGGAITSKTSTAGLSDQSITFSESGSGNGYGVRLGHVSNTELAFERYDFGWVETVRIDGAGRVGIGTTSPSSPLTVEQSSANINLELHSTGSGRGTQIKTHNDHATFYHGLAGDTTGNFLYYTADAKDHVFYANNSERMRISSAGEVKIGGNISQYYGQASGYMLAVQGPTSAAQTFISIPAPGQTADSQGLIIGTDNNASLFWQRDYKNLVFGVGNTERMRLSSDGICQIRTQSNNGFVCASQQGSGTSNFLFQGGHSSTGVGSYTPSFRVSTNGDITNTNNSLNAISDLKLKENIVDAKSQWDDIKGIRLRNYNFKAETGHETHTQLGVIAQELEAVCPKLVKETTDEDGETTKSVAYSVLYMKAVGALQEAMERIETLEAKVAALETN